MARRRLRSVGLLKRLAASKLLFLRSGSALRQAQPRAGRRKTRRDSNRRWMKVQWQVTQTNGERQILSINVLALPLSKIWTGYGARLWLLRYPVAYYRYNCPLGSPSGELAEKGIPTCVSSV
jgi:hypothetical protein